MGTIATFDPQGSADTYPSDINARGAITGYYQDATNVTHGFLRAPGGAITAFDPPNSFISTIACCITSAGTIVGNYIAPGYGPEHGYLRASNGAYTVFDPPGSFFTVPVAINSGGTITGQWCDLNNICHGFLLRPRDTGGL
jgi:hypothetical protein